MHKWDMTTTRQRVSTLVIKTMICKACQNLIVAKQCLCFSPNTAKVGKKVDRYCFLF
jgi:hypothetical protein